MAESSKVVELQSGALRLAVRPDLGACIAGLWQHGLPVLRSTDPSVLASSRASGCYPLLPYSNRIAWQRFSWLGREYTTQRNFDENPHSVHGVGWQRAWTVASQSESEALLTLVHVPDADWPFAFEASQSFKLTDTSLEIVLTLKNTDAQAVPVGLGWHPYFPKRERSRLHIELTHRWDSDPTTELPVRLVPQPGIDADVAQLSYDNCFEGFAGPARIRDEALSLKLTSSLSYLVVYTPKEKGYYCVEPVSHANAAINMTDPLAHGIQSVEPGQSYSATMKIEIADVH